MAGIIVADTIQSGGDFIRLNSASQTVATINASGIYANTGNLLIAANGTIGVASITNTAITGTITQAQLGSNIAGNGPAFSAYLGSNQTVTNSVNTKVQCNTEEFDTASCYDTSLFRFTPNVAGYYQFNWQISVRSATNVIRFASYLYKNGSSAKHGGDIAFNSSGANGFKIGGSGLVYANGTTDYFEMFAYVETSSGTNVFNTNGGADSFFQGFLARAA
jgi:hypothetical protein